MRTPKITDSKDGVKRFNVGVVFRIDKSFLVNWLSKRISDSQGEVFGENGEITLEKQNIFSKKSQLIAELKECLYVDGHESHFYWGANRSMETISKIQAKANTIIEKFFPEL